MQVKKFPKIQRFYLFEPCFPFSIDFKRHRCVLLSQKSKRSKESIQFLPIKVAKVASCVKAMAYLKVLQNNN